MKKITVFAAAALLVLPSCASALQYDGLWFLGFNMKKPIFQGARGKEVRKAFNYAINRADICTKIASCETVPSGVIPAGMTGSGSVEGFSYDPSKAKALLKKAGFAKNDRRLRGLVLLHSDGDTTKKIAAAVRSDLEKIGIKIGMKTVPYGIENVWEDELAKARYPLFLMGYKVLRDIEDDTSSAEASEETSDSSAVSRSTEFLYDLFASDGEANMFFLDKPAIDRVLLKVSRLPSSKTTEGENILRGLNRMLQDDPVTVNLFYIKRL